MYTLLRIKGTLIHRSQQWAYDCTDIVLQPSIT